MPTHPIVTRAEWLVQRKELLAAEKAFTQAREALAVRRRALPWVRVDKPYTFDGAAGDVPFAALFGDRTQLVVYHLMFGPDEKVACPLCSFWADNFDRSVVHLAHRDVAMVAISRAPLPKLQAYRDRMRWTFPWYSSGKTSFNQDFHVTIPAAEDELGPDNYNYASGGRAGEAPGISVFVKDDSGAIFHTYSCFARGLDMMNATYQYLDLVPKGRDEGALPFTMNWVRRWDEYGG